jgi:hypothetical protein
MLSWSIGRGQEQEALGNEATCRSIVWPRTHNLAHRDKRMRDAAGKLASWGSRIRKKIAGDPALSIGGLSPTFRSVSLA